MQFVQCSVYPLISNDADYSEDLGRLGRSYGSDKKRQVSLRKTTTQKQLKLKATFIQEERWGEEDAKKLKEHGPFYESSQGCADTPLHTLIFWGLWIPVRPSLLASPRCFAPATKTNADMADEWNMRAFLDADHKNEHCYSSKTAGHKLWSVLSKKLAKFWSK